MFTYEVERGFRYLSKLLQTAEVVVTYDERSSGKKLIAFKLEDFISHSDCPSYLKEKLVACRAIESSSRVRGFWCIYTDEYDKTELYWWSMYDGIIFYITSRIEIAKYTEIRRMTEAHI